MSQQKGANKAGWSIFDEVFYRGVMAGNPAFDTRKSLEWYYDFIRKNVNTANPFKKTQDWFQPVVKPGYMYIYKYHAKYEKELPYWDAVPLVFPFKDEGKTFLALNLHYAPPKARILIMKMLYRFISDTKMDEKTKLRLSYAKLQRLAKFDYFKPLIKRYLKDHVRSLFVQVPIRYWPVAAFLPIAKWQKQTANTVYRDFNKGTTTKQNKIIKVRKNAV